MWARVCWCRSRGHIVTARLSSTSWQIFWHRPRLVRVRLRRLSCRRWCPWHTQCKEQFTVRQRKYKKMLTPKLRQKSLLKTYSSSHMSVTTIYFLLHVSLVLSGLHMYIPGGSVPAPLPWRGRVRALPLRRDDSNTDVAAVMWARVCWCHSDVSKSVLTL